MMTSAVQPPAGYNALASSEWWRRFASVRLLRFAPRGLALRSQQPGLQQLIEMCRVVDYRFWSIRDHLCIEHGTTACCSGSRAASTSTNWICCASARSRPLREGAPGELVVAAPVGFVKAGDRYEKIGWRFQERSSCVRQVEELGSARQAALLAPEYNLDCR